MTLAIDQNYLERLRMGADLEERKAKAKLDQYPEEDPEHRQLSDYITLAAIGTAMALHDDPGEELPVPFDLVELPNAFLVPFGESRVGLAWADLDQAKIVENAWGPDLVESSVIPLYGAQRIDHGTINQILIDNQAWFIESFTRQESIKAEKARYKRIVSANHFIQEAIDALIGEKDAQAQGAAPEAAWPQAD